MQTSSGATVTLFGRTREASSLPGLAQASVSDPNPRAVGRYGPRARKRRRQHGRRFCIKKTIQKKGSLKERKVALTEEEEANDDDGMITIRRIIGGRIWQSWQRLSARSQN